VDKSWELEHPDDCSPDRFYTKATDNHGHSELVHLKVPPGTLSTIAQIVQSRAIPEYRTSHDLIRDAIVHRLHYLRESGLVDGVANTLAGFEELANELFKLQQHMESFEGIMRQTEDWVAKLGRDSEKARDMVRRLYARALAIDDGYWRNRYIEEIERKFRLLLEDLT